MLSRNRQWIDLVEFRVDMLKPAERGVDDLSAWWQATARPLPVILTVRRSQDGGRWEGDEAQRLNLLGRLVQALEPAYLDIELDRTGIPDWDRLAATVRSLGGTVIRSHHDVRHTPEDLSRVIAPLAAAPDEIPKLAVTAQTTADAMRLTAAAREFSRLMPGRRGIWVAMGPYGITTRVWPSRTRSFLTYASDPEGVPAAPGHLTPQVLHEVYRIGAVKGDWTAFAVVGDPVIHSRSPEYHNARFSTDRLKVVYLPIALDTFHTFPQCGELLSLQGASVTVPHKEAALAFVESMGGTVTDGARRSGAVNTLWRNDAGQWCGDNTDIPAFRESLGIDPGGMKVLVVGAGGAARAVLTALEGVVASVTLVNRTARRARDLAERFRLEKTRICAPEELESFPAGSFDLVVQTTTVGMHHGPEGDPAAGYRFGGEEIVYDVIYTPAESPFLRRAREAGCRTINGAGMFRRQAELQYERFRTLLTGAGNG